jgi:restriction system protein
MAKRKQAEFTRYLGPVLKALRELGGSGRPKEVIEKVAKNLNISEEIRQETLKNGASKWDNQVAWARQYLVYAGLIDNTKKGVWILTPLGQKTDLNEKQAHEIFLKQVSMYRKSREGKKDNENIKEIEDESDEEIEKEETLFSMCQV